MFSFQTRFSMLKAILTKKSPFYIQYYIDGRCNLKCKQCNIVEANSGLLEADLPKVEKIADNLRAIGAGVVLLTGGEPFLRKDLPGIVKIFTSRNLNVRLQTAGMKVATPEMLKACVDAGGRDINISLDSLIEDKQDYINSVPGSWREALKTIASVTRIFPKNDSICGFGCVISRFNFQEIPAILELATEIGWYLSLVPVHITRADLPMGFRSYDNTFKFTAEEESDLNAIYNKLFSMKRQGYNLFDSWKFLESSLEFIKTGHPTWRKNDVCDSPFLYFAIQPNGDFSVCCDYKYSDASGKKISVANPDFPRIYHSAEFQNRIYQTTSKCSGCNYGSYPEMTIFARDPKAILERVFLNFKVMRQGIRSVQDDEIFEIVDSIKKRYPEAYDESRMPKDIQNILQLWRTPEGRFHLQQEDLKRRQEEGRIRKPVPISIKS